MPSTSLTEGTVATPRHTSFYLAAGPERGPPVIFIHGWPELSLSWRHQLPCLAGLGFRAIAPDMRGYGRSSVYRNHADYGLQHAVADMIELADRLGIEKAVWVGHDWGSPVAWSIASHHPERCHAVASLCVPYWTIEHGLDSIIALVDRQVYPEDQFPAGQWEYMRFYEENFEKATKSFEAHPYNSVKAMFRKGDPSGHLKPALTAFVRRNGGWFRGAGQAPDIPHDADVVTEEELRIYADGLERNGFFGPDSWYMNHAANAAYAKSAVNGGRLDMPALFIAARYDYTVETITSRLAEPMHERCTDLTTATLDCGHWMAQEKPTEVNALLVKWLATRVPGAWPG
jgi:pimeloyl-ACP methyl ester carboxylesterase